MDAHPWPANSDGLSSNYFTITAQATAPGDDDDVLVLQRGGQSVAGGAGHGYLIAKPDPYDGAYVSGRPHAWQASLPAADLEKRFGIARVERIQILTRDCEVDVRSTTTAGGGRARGCRSVRVPRPGRVANQSASRAGSHIRERPNRAGAGASPRAA
ncbi:hypothetical protein [Intrasporangium sp.]|uniref:hypothetical protein n=1 Tax=Intrasporangium sp. TaxID=1925024 RepID=UPI0032216B7B